MEGVTGVVCGVVVEGVAGVCDGTAVLIFSSESLRLMSDQMALRSHIVERFGEKLKF